MFLLFYTICILLGATPNFQLTLAHRQDSLNGLLELESSKPFHMHQVLLMVFDNRKFFELKSQFAKNMITGFARLSGEVVRVAWHERGNYNDA